MSLQRAFCDVEFKVVGDTPGLFEGYASVFGNTDFYGDVVAPGAFTQTINEWKGRGRWFPMYLNHGAALGAPGLPAGKWLDVSEDSRGLAVKGQLLGLDTETGRYYHSLMRDGALQGLSIGFRAKESSYGKKPGEPRRTLKSVDLVEISLVDVPANSAAQVSTLKSACADPIQPEIDAANELLKLLLRVKG
jgi:HK97 family phage prohead protease